MTEPEELGSGRTANLTEDEIDALWSRMRMDSLMSHVTSLVVRNPHDGVGG
jgi:hypothetical protein